MDAKTEQDQSATADATKAKSSVPAREDNLIYDLKHLAAFDIAPLPAETNLLEYSRDSVQLLVNKIFGLKHENSEDGTMVQLPQEEGFKLPRSKPAPKEKPKTRWEKFMEERNMTKRKRSSLVWDEAAGDWKRRWGYKSVKKSEDEAMGIVEVKEGQDPNENPFEKRAAEKKLLQARQKMREVRNKVEGAGGKMKAAVPDLGSGKHDGRKLKQLGQKPGKRDRDGLDEALRNAQISTASFGRFDKVAPNERRNLQRHTTTIKGNASAGDEKERYLKQATRVLNGDGKIDKEKAAKLGGKSAAASQSVPRGKKGGGSQRRSKQGGKKNRRR
mmetsp:Transcript_43087/g.99215  ORF Transcript_43087/g.99215 Transcript_43087/m.99215 type:complete len:330 (-) Transcript_43087:93-1082(-)